MSSDPNTNVFLLVREIITSINITELPGIDKNVSLTTVGSKRGLTKGVIKLTDSTFNVNIAACSNVTYVLKANVSMSNTTKVYATLGNYNY